MTARAVPLIKRVRQTRYQASDGTFFASHVEAFRHETFIQLRDLIALRLQRYHDDPAELARALLDSSDFRVVLLGPREPAPGSAS